MSKKNEKAPKKPDHQPAQARFEEKWGDGALVMGWTGIPTSLFFLQGTLSLSPLAFNVLINLIAHWWKLGEWPHPSQELISKRMNLSVRTIQRGIAELEDAGIVLKQRTSQDHPKYKGRNIYNLTPLVELLNNFTPDLKEKINKSDMK